MVLIALRLCKPENAPGLESMFERALAWLLSFQCRNGGWGAFDKEVTKNWLEDVPFADHNAILDPTCSDLTGRTLELLGYIGFNREDRRVQRGHRIPPAHPGGRRLLVRPLGRQLHLRHLAGPARTARHRPQYE